ncbi:hypothetical protein A2U01_0091164, partial [Trifolium medium]|nr:hypothetical protein [Trifolium medium]
VDAVMVVVDAVRNAA